MRILEFDNKAKSVYIKNTDLALLCLKVKLGGKK